MHATRMMYQQLKLPLPVDLDFFYTFAGYSIYRCSMMTVVKISLVSIFGTSFSISSNAYDAHCMC